MSCKRQKLLTRREHMVHLLFYNWVRVVHHFSFLCDAVCICLSSSCVLCAQCCQCLWIVFVLCIVCSVLPVSLDCLRPVYCVLSVVSVSGLSSSCVLCAQCCQCLWIVFVLCIVCSVLPVSLDCPLLITLSIFSNVY